MIAARMITGRVHLFPEPGGNSLCSAEGTRNPLKAPPAEYLDFIPLKEALTDIDLCSTCRREYIRSLASRARTCRCHLVKAESAPKPAKKQGRQK